MTGIQLVDHLTLAGWRDAASQREALVETCLDRCGYRRIDEFLDDVGQMTATVLLAGGAATRWKDSLRRHPDLARRYSVNERDARVLAEVENVLPGELQHRQHIPMLTYSYFAARPLARHGTHFTIYGAPEDAERFAAAATSVGVDTQLHRQHVHPGRSKVAGHADALHQMLPALRSFRYVITHFGADAASTTTLLTSLLVLHALVEHGSDVVQLIMPTAIEGAQPYPVFLDGTGHVRRFGHAKLLGDTSLLDQSLTPGGSNIGIRAYLGGPLRDTLQRYGALQAAPGGFTTLPGHDESADEFALDDVDAALAETGAVRQLAIASPEESGTQAKEIDKVDAYVRAQAVIVDRDTADA